ncbi:MULTISPECIES: MurR/RpiR family transcriptional regulator [unclassified Mesorhizobium]|uniref:MurR/RpiR family transcriptional regulator n=1 Tax=unclassified Mesorhizobium TaxID=325217 RepID=UPI001093D4EA|nr:MULTISPECIES: MurR/RpiR family transcriptional regulator [unclassified Mesorhizobium]TGT91327.1 MurR/RpiR family transcriptional regulator [Mesorhizobium sp. M8A.F.Ca.ET.161.01.1.1]TGV43395.1 MurR/RpiR family transcriptional regulator [Mesorhizobium sp. M8A.F.Ca.ET.142.01.1.1]
MNETANGDQARGTSLNASNTPLDRRALQAEIDSRTAGQRLTPAQRRIAQCMMENSTQLGFLSSMELADLANVSQPSVTRFAMALGFDGYLEMRRFLRSVQTAEEATGESETNRYQSAILAEASNLTELALSLADSSVVDRFGQALAASRPLAVLGLRASAGLAAQFAYFAAKVHPDVRLLAGGGSLIEDQIEQCRVAGARTMLVFMMPLYPRETLKAIELARQTGMQIALVTDASFNDHDGIADQLIAARVSSKLVFDSYAASATLVSVLLDAMCNNMNGQARKRLDDVDRSSKKRKVFL